HQNSKIQHHYPTLSQKKEKPASVWDNCVCFTPNRAIQYDANNVGRNNHDLIEELVDPLIDHLSKHQEKPPEMISICLARGGKKKLCEILASFDGDPVSEMFRKNQTLDVSITTRMKDNTLNIKIALHEIQRVSHAHDFQGSGGIKSDIPDVGFDDIAGHYLVKKRMGEIVKILKNPDGIEALDVGIPKGMLLWGAPGTGKTLLAKALAFEADLPFISTTGSELLDLDFVKSVFSRARKYAPSILFIDEIDAIGARGRGGFDVIINQLLIEIDGFDTSLSDPVFIIAATNLPEKIDPALTRSGRIDLKVKVPMLDRDARAYFIEQYFQLPHDGSLDKNVLLSHTAGMNGADLEKVKRESVLEMISSGLSEINMQLLTEQINTLKYGVRSVNTKLLQSLDATAYHEAGHAIVSMVVNPDVLIEQVTVMPREGALGFVSYDVESLQYRQINRKEVLDNMAVALAGRMAQSKQFAEHGDDSGASSDLKKATMWAIHAISKLGLDARVGHAVLTFDDELPELTDGGMLFERVQAWLQEAEKQCALIVEQHWDAIDTLAKRLIKDEVITGEELRRDFRIR
ncbi:MAG: AAA family ATPase, partial [Mariprofundaceae bacterium]